MQILFNWLISALVIIAASYLLPGVHLESFKAALAAALVLGIINTFIKPVLLLLTLPINLLSLGLFTFVVMGLLVMLTASLVPGFKVDNFGWALLFGLIVSLFSFFLHHFKS